MTLSRRQFIYSSAVMTVGKLALPQSALARSTEKLWGGLSSPVGMGFDAAGALFVAEWSAGRITKIKANGQRSVFASGLSGPSGLAVAADGRIYVASYSSDVIWRFTPKGQRETFLTGLATPAGLSFDLRGRLMVANRQTNQILVLEKDKLEPLISDLRTPVGAVQTPDGGYVVSNIGGGVTVIAPDGTRVEAGGAFQTPGPGIAQTRDGRVFVVDYGGTTVREIVKTGTSRTIADGFSSPVGLVVAPDGKSLLTACWGEGAVWHIPL